MKKILLFGLLAASGSHAEPPLVNANCQDMKFEVNTVQKNRFNFGAYWYEPAVFPNQPKYMEIGDKTSSSGSDILKFKIICDDFSTNYDGNIAEINAANYDAVLEKLGRNNTDLNLYIRTGYKYPNIKKGFWSIGYDFSLKDFSLKILGKSLKEGDDLRNDFSTINSVESSALIGYKVDGGDLKPLLYDRKVSNYLNDFESAKIIEIFHKNSGNEDAVTIQKILIDKQSGNLKIYRKFKFPDK